MFRPEEDVVQFKIVTVGSIQGGSIDDALVEYLERVDSYVSTEVLEVEAAGAGSPAERMREEAAAMERAAPEGGTSVALDGSGRSISSETFSEWIDDQMVGGIRYISFFVGGADGLDPSFRDQTCDWSLSLSSMTLPHEMARLMLIEQLYRAMTIIRGEPYHK
jgi:23S rRNA (pseudouridine1915-N3)-methyltransferase